MQQQNESSDKAPCVFWYPGYALPLGNIVRAENCSLYDAEGKRYIDLESGVWCMSIGHGHPRILRAMTEPGSSSGLVRFPPEKLVRSMVSAVKANGGLVLQQFTVNRNQFSRRGAETQRPHRVLIFLIAKKKSMSHITP